MPFHPTCPRCGNLCGRFARRCADCGARLYMDDDYNARHGLDENGRDRLLSRPLTTAEERRARIRRSFGEDTAPTEERGT